MRCQLRIACPALKRFSLYLVNNFEELSDVNAKTSKTGSFKLLCSFLALKNMSWEGEIWFS